jgi:hypothetical protein
MSNKITYTIAIIESPVIETEKMEKGTLVNYVVPGQLLSDFRTIREYVDSNAVIFEQDGLGHIQYLKKVQVVIVSDESKNAFSEGDRYISGLDGQIRVYGIIPPDIFREPRKIIGNAPSNIINEMISSPGLLPKRKPGDEVQLILESPYEASEDERNIPAEEMDLEEFEEKPCLNIDGTVNCK